MADLATIDIDPKGDVILLCGSEDDAYIFHDLHKNGH